MPKLTLILLALLLIPFSADAATLVDDTFTEGSNTNLQSHTPDTGSGYTFLSGATQQIKASLDALGSDPTRSLYKNDTAIGSADYDAYITIKHGGSAYIPTMVCVRINGASNDRYCGGLVDNGGNPASGIIKVVSGVETSLGVGDTFGPAIDDIYRLNVTGSSLTLYRNGVSKVTATDSAVTAIGNAGMDFKGSNSGTDSIDIQIDNFQVVGTAAGGGSFTGYRETVRFFEWI